MNKKLYFTEHAFIDVPVDLYTQLKDELDQIMILNNLLDKDIKIITELHNITKIGMHVGEMLFIIEDSNEMKVVKLFKLTTDTLRGRYYKTIYVFEQYKDYNIHKSPYYTLLKCLKYIKNEM